jgi:nucleoid-associated protein YgaU
MAIFEELQAKYKPVLDKGHEVGLSVQNLNLEGDKLLIRGVVPSDYGKNALWDVVKRIDPNIPDVIIDINVQSGLTYAIASGDTLSKIARRFYGDANAFHKIFDANRDQLSDPNRINAGQVLKLP